MTFTGMIVAERRSKKQRTAIIIRRTASMENVSQNAIQIVLVRSAVTMAVGVAVAHVLLEKHVLTDSV
jgi:hypothetical protein